MRIDPEGTTGEQLLFMFVTLCAFIAFVAAIVGIGYLVVWLGGMFWSDVVCRHWLVCR